MRRKRLRFSPSFRRFCVDEADHVYNAPETVATLRRGRGAVVAWPLVTSITGEKKVCGQAFIYTRKGDPRLPFFGEGPNPRAASHDERTGGERRFGA